MDNKTNKLFVTNLTNEKTYTVLFLPIFYNFNLISAVTFKHTEWILFIDIDALYYALNMLFETSYVI